MDDRRRRDACARDMEARRRAEQKLHRAMGEFRRTVQPDAGNPFGLAGMLSRPDAAGGVNPTTGRMPWE